MQEIVINFTLFVVATVLFTIAGMISKSISGYDIVRILVRLSFVIPIILLFIWVFSTPSETPEQVGENITTLTYWFVNFIINVLIPFILGESISSIVYSFARPKP